MPIICIINSKSLHDAVYSSKVPYTSLWKKTKIYSVTQVNSSDKLVDCLTKERASCEKLCDVEIEINSTKKHKLKQKKIKEREKKSMK